MEGVNAEEVRGDVQRAVQNYEAAIALDSGFAMAWRKLSVVLRNNQLDANKVMRSITEAWKHRDRLSDQERAITEGSYYMSGPEPDPEKALAAYEQLLATDSTNRTALNNAAAIHLQFRRIDKADAMFRLASKQPTANAQLYLNMQRAAMVGARAPATLDSTEQELRAKFPTYSGLWEASAYSLFTHDKLDSLEGLVRGVRRTARGLRQELQSTSWLDAVGLYQGKLKQAMQYSTEFALGEARAGLDPSTASDSPVNVWMRAGMDSAMYAVLLGGNESSARAYLKGATSQRAVDAVPAADRDWIDLANAAALAGDSISGRIAGEGYKRDILPEDPWRRIRAPRVDAFVALSQGNWDGAIQSLAALLKQLGSPGIEEAFYMAMAHDRAGRSDSAIVWYNRAITSGSMNVYSHAGLWPAAHRRLGELYDRQENTAKAIEHYEWFADRWKNADPELQPTVKAIRARAAELRARRAPG
jgi:tetratricopeptide (TPR) repeat protein